MDSNLLLNRLGRPRFIFLLRFFNGRHPAFVILFGHVVHAPRATVNQILVFNRLSFGSLAFLNPLLSTRQRLRLLWICRLLLLQLLLLKMLLVPLLLLKLLLVLLLLVLLLLPLAGLIAIAT